MAFTGSTVPARVQSAWTAAAGARDAAIAFVQDGIAAGRSVRGFEVDATARKVLIDAGYAAHVLHRTGHSLGQEIHGNGVHMDDYETHDDRRLVPGLGFTIEPGLYFDDFGIRTEIDMTVGLRAGHRHGRHPDTDRHAGLIRHHGPLGPQSCQRARRPSSTPP